MAYDIGTARGVIEMEYNGRGIDQAKEDLAGLEKSGADAQAAQDRLASNAGRMGLVIAAGLAGGVYAAANFEQRLSAISAVSGATGDDLDKLRDKALQLGKDTSFSATESASAIEELVKAGLSVEDVLNGAADATVSLAAAGEIALPEAATIASNAMNQFNLGAEDMVGVVDNIAGAANASAIDVSDFGQSMQQVGAVANLAGVDFEDAATAIALLGNAGIRGSDAGTSLKSMFQRLQPTTKKQSELFKELGIITEDGTNRFYDQQGNLKDLASVSGILQNSLKGMTAQQKQATLTTLFGSDAIRAAAVLANQGAKGFDKMADSMSKTSAAEVAKTRMDNLKGSFEEMMGSLETAGIQIGTILIPPVTALVALITTLLDAFLSLPSGVQSAIVGFLGAVSAILLLISVISKFVAFQKTVQLALAGTRLAFISTWLAALGPIGLVIAAVIAIIAIVVLLWKKSETFRNIVLGVWNAIKAAAMAVANFFSGPFLDAFTTAWDAIKTGLSALGSFFSALWDGIVAVITTAVNIIKTIVMTYFNIYKTIIMTILNVLMAIWRTFWNIFGGVIKAVLGIVVALIKLYFTIIKSIITIALAVIKAIWITFWNGLKTVVMPVINFIKGAVRAFMAVVRAVFNAGWNAIKAVTSAVWNAIRGVISGVLGAIRSVVSSGVNTVKSVMSNAWNAVRNGVINMWNGIKSLFTSNIATIGNIMENIKSAVLDPITGLIGDMAAKGREIIEALAGGIRDAIGSVTDAVGDVTSAVTGLLPGSPVKEGPLRVLNRGHAGKQIVQMLIDGIDSMAPALAAAAESTVRPAAVAVASPTPGLTPTPRRRGRRGRRGGLRMIDGELRLDESGRAFISGVASDTDDDDADFDDTLGRMN